MPINHPPFPPINYSPDSATSVSNALAFGASWKVPVSYTPADPVIRTNGPFVACQPMPVRHVEQKVKGGFAMINNKKSLTELKVVFTSGDKQQFPADSSVWVRSDSYTYQWAKDVLELDGVEFILVPESAIQLVR